MLREDLIDYFQSAMFNSSPIAIADLTEVEYANDEQIIRIVIKNNFDINSYINLFIR